MIHIRFLNLNKTTFPKILAPETSLLHANSKNIRTHRYSLQNKPTNAFAIKSPNLKPCVQAYLFLKNFKFLFALFYPHLDPRRRPSLWRRISENRSAGNEHTFLLCSLSPSPWCAAKTFLFLYFIRSSHAKDLH